METIELLYKVYFNAKSSSADNAEKIRRWGFEPMQKNHLFGNYYVELVNAHKSIYTRFYKGNKEIKRETALKAFQDYLNKFED